MTEHRQNSQIQENKNLEFVTLFLTVLTLTLTITGLILAVWGVDSLAEAEDFLNDQVAKKTAVLESKTYLQTAQLREFVDDIAFVNNVFLDKKMRDFEGKLAKTEQTIIENPPHDPYKFPVLESRLNKAKNEFKHATNFEQKKQYVESAKVAYNAMKQMAIEQKKVLPGQYIFDYFGLIAEYAADNQARKKDAAFIQNEIKRLNDQTIQQYESRFIQADLRRLQGRIYFILSKKNLAFESLNQAMLLHTRKEYMLDYIRWSSKDTEPDDKLYRMIRRILIMRLYQNPSELQSQTNWLINQLPHLKQNIKQIQQKMEKYMQVVKG